MTDPYRILDIARDADDATIRAAYLAAVRDCPPERDAARFAALRRAYDMLSNQRTRLQHALFNREAPTADDFFHALREGFTPSRPTPQTLLRLISGSDHGR